MLGAGFGLTGLPARKGSDATITRLVLSGFSVPENASTGTVVATLTVVGPDYLAPAAFTLTSDPGNNFEVVGNELRVKTGAALDFETEAFHLISISAMDANPTVYTRDTGIAVTNVNEQPTDITLSANSIPENTQPGSIIGTLSTTDVDAGDTFTYSIETDTDARFAISGDNLTVRTGASFDFETATSHNVTVRSTDAGGLFTTKLFTINITNIIETFDTIVFGLLGQSNDVGNAVKDTGPVFPAGTQQYNQAGSFVAAVSPLSHVSAPGNSMGLDVQFEIDRKLDTPTKSTIFVPCALGSTGFQDNRWNKGDDLYEAAVARLNAVMAANPDAQFGGFLWNQGERDCVASGAHQAALDAMVNNLRIDVLAADSTTPFVASSFSDQFIQLGPRATQVDRQLVNDNMVNLPSRISYCAAVDADLLTLNVDNIHYPADQIRLLGTYYNQNWLSALTNSGSVAPQLVEPGEIQNLVVAEGDTELVLTWPAPVYDGGSAVTGYRVDRQVAGGAFSTLVTIGTPTTGHTDTGLTNGTEYGYRVYALNSVGYGVASAIKLQTPAVVVGYSFEADVIHEWLPDVGTNDRVGTANLTAIDTATISADTARGDNVFNLSTNNAAYSATINSFIGLSYTKMCWFNDNDPDNTINLMSSGLTSGSGHFLFYTPSRFRGVHNNTFDLITVDTAKTSNVWHHLALTYDASTLVMALYYDGALLGTASGVPAPTAWDTTMYLGALGNSATNGLVGLMGPSLVTDTALTLAEVVEHRVATKGNLVI